MNAARDILQFSKVRISPNSTLGEDIIKLMKEYARLVALDALFRASEEANNLCNTHDPLGSEVKKIILDIDLKLP